MYVRYAENLDMLKSFQALANIKNIKPKIVFFYYIYFY